MNELIGIGIHVESISLSTSIFFVLFGSASLFLSFSRVSCRSIYRLAFATRSISSFFLIANEF